MSVVRIPRPSPRQRELITKFLTHLICIGILFVLPEVLMGLAHTHSGHISWGMYAKSMVFVTVFYVNYYFVIDRWAGRDHSFERFCVYNLTLIAAALVLTYIIMRFGFHHRGMSSGSPKIGTVIGFLSRDLAMTVLTMGLSVALKLSDRWRRLERRRQMLAAATREQELSQLKSQLNPHFLFNSLNTIYALIAISPECAQEAVHTMSRLLRYALYDSAGNVTLQQEIDFLNDYIHLMSMRIGDRPGLHVSLDAGEHDDTPIPSMLFISMVENVFKHGNTGLVDDPFLITLTTEGDTLRFTTENRYDPTREKADASGIGMVNVRRRLGLLYGSGASLECHTEGDRYIVTMTLDLSCNPEQPSSDCSLSQFCNNQTI